MDRYVFIRHEVMNLIERLNPDKIGMEQSVFGSSQSPAMYALFITTLEAVKRSQKDVVLWSPTQLKSLARTLVKRPPKWKMEKSDMIEAAQKANNFKEKWNDNEADAFLIAVFSSRWWEYYTGKIMQSEFNKEEVHAFVEITYHVRGKKAGKVAYKGIEHAQGEKFFLWSGIEKEKIGGKKQSSSSGRTTKKSIRKKQEVQV